MTTINVKKIEAKIDPAFLSQQKAMQKSFLALQKLMNSEKRDFTTVEKIADKSFIFWSQATNLSVALRDLRRIEAATKKQTVKQRAVSLKSLKKEASKLEKLKQYDLPVRTQVIPKSLYSFQES